LLSSPFPKHEANMSTYARHHQNVSQHRAKNLHPVALDECIYITLRGRAREKGTSKAKREEDKTTTALQLTNKMTATLVLCTVQYI